MNLNGYTVQELDLLLERDLVRNFTMAFDPIVKEWGLLILEESQDNHWPLCKYRGGKPRTWKQAHRVVDFVAKLRARRIATLTVSLVAYRDFLEATNQLGNIEE